MKADERPASWTQAEEQELVDWMISDQGVEPAENLYVNVMSYADDTISSTPQGMDDSTDWLLEVTLEGAGLAITVHLD
mgnify:CR=1 FL=1